MARRLPARRWKARRRESWSLGSSFANWRYSFETWPLRKAVATAVRRSPGSATVVRAISAPSTLMTSSAG
ncbi:MAG TPA: hypothetical protein VFN18_12260 [Solirubrobacterales bacterium]|nr:hypothetical protein [Solirubrobacterales bacterium]